MNPNPMSEISTKELLKMHKRSVREWLRLVPYFGINVHPTLEQFQRVIEAEIFDRAVEAL